MPLTGQSSHIIQVESMEKQDGERTLIDEEIENIYRQRCKDCALNFQNMAPQFDKFKKYVFNNSINRKIILNDLSLSLNFAKYMVGLFQSHSIKNFDKIS